MERLPRQQYTKEFREQAVRLVLEQELTTPEAARRLAISGKTLANWVFRARHGRLAGLGETRRPVTELEAEVSRLKRELAEARMERDILKKATAYLAKAQLPGTHVKTEVGCPQNTEVRCPLFTDEIVHSVGSARRIGCHLEQLGG